MSLETLTTYNGPLNANGSTTAFPFTFKAMGEDEITVAAYDADGAVATLPAYLVSLGDPGGTITFETAPANGLKIWISSNPDFAQEIAFEDGSRWLAGPVNEANDRAAVRALFLKDQAARSLKVPLGSASPAVDLTGANDGDVLALVDGQVRPVTNDATGAAASAAAARADRLLSDENVAQTAADVAAVDAVVAMLPARYAKLQDSTIQSDASLNVDADLAVPLAAGSLVLIRGRIFYTTSAAADFKWRHTGPASPTRVRLKRQAILPGDSAFSDIAEDTAFSGSDIVLMGGGGSGVIEIEAMISNGVNAGSFGVSWSQNTSDASDTTVEAGSYLEVVKLPVPATYAFDDAAIAMLGDFSPSSAGGHNFMVASGDAIANSHLETVAHGTKLEAQVFQGDYLVIVDGGAPVTITAPTGFSFIELFSGLPDAAHRVSVTGAYFDSDVTFRVSGSDPRLTRPNDIPLYYQLHSNLPNIAVEGISRRQELFGSGGNTYYLEKSTAALCRFRATTTAIKLWMYLSDDLNVCLLRDGAQVGDIIALPATGGKFGIVTVADGLSGTHNYEIQPLSLLKDSYTYAVLVDTLVPTAQTPKNAHFYLGDSIVAGTILPDLSDARVLDSYLVAEALGCVAVRDGQSGASVTTDLRDKGHKAGDVAEGAVTLIVNEGGTNDLQLGHDLDTFQADYQTMLEAERAAQPDAVILAQGIYPVSATWPNHAQRDTYNERIEAAVAAIGDDNIHYVTTDGWFDPVTDTVDGAAHPNETGYALIAAAREAWMAANL